MKLVPRSFLRRFYVAKSLRRIQNGFIFRLRTPMPLRLTTVHSVMIDGEPWPATSVSLDVDGQTTQATDISPDRPWNAGGRALVLVRVQGRILGSGKHRIELPVTAATFGRLDLALTDSTHEDAPGEQDAPSEDGPRPPKKR